MSEIEHVAKESWVEKFCEERPDLFFPESWSDDKKEKGMSALRSENTYSRMFSSIPIKCRGRNCPYADICPFALSGEDPMGRPCPIELSMVKQLMGELMREFRVDDKSANEVSMIRDLVNQEIQHVRVTNLLSREDFIQDVFAGVNERTGEVIFKKELHSAIDFEDRLLKRKKELRNQFLATREAKAKIGMGQIDTSKVVSDILFDVEQVRIEREKAAREKLGIPEIDHYIQDSEAVTDAEIVED